MSLEQAIAAHEAWKKRYDELPDPPGKYEQKGEESPIKKRAFYQPHMKAWEAWAGQEERTISQLRDKMEQISGFRPSDTCVAKWATDRQIDFIHVRKRLYLTGDLQKEIVRRHAAKESCKAIARWLEQERGIVVNERQVSSAVHGYKRLKR